MTKRQLTKLAFLLARIHALTQQRGRKKELATYLGVTQQRLNDWLSGRVAPGGEITLQMLEWVQAEEAKQPKTLGSASNTTKGHKTRPLNPSNEKSKRVRKRS